MMHMIFQMVIHDRKIVLNSEIKNKMFKTRRNASLISYFLFLQEGIYFNGKRGGSRQG